MPRPARTAGSPARLRGCSWSASSSSTTTIWVFVGRRRGDHNRLGFAVQLATVRFVGTFLADLGDVPGDVVEYVAAQLDVAAATMATYTQREKTRLEHQWEIAREVGYRDFADAEADLAVWVDDRAWTTGEGPIAVFDGAVGWLRERRVLLPGVTTLARLVARERDAATLRTWTELAQSASGGQARRLRGLLVVPDGARSLTGCARPRPSRRAPGWSGRCAACPTSLVWGWAALT